MNTQIPEDAFQRVISRVAECEGKCTHIFLPLTWKEDLLAMRREMWLPDDGSGFPSRWQDFTSMIHFTESGPWHLLGAHVFFVEAEDVMAFSLKPVLRVGSDQWEPTLVDVDALVAAFTAAEKDKRSTVVPAWPGCGKTDAE